MNNRTYKTQNGQIFEKRSEHPFTHRSFVSFKDSDNIERTGKFAYHHSEEEANERINNIRSEFVIPEGKTFVLVAKLEPLEMITP